MYRLPVFASQLVEELNKSHPARCMRVGETVEEHQRYAGGRDLIDSLVIRLQATVDQDPTQAVGARQ
jgi:hypothetical protein